MTEIITLELPHALVQSINKACKRDGCTTHELIRTAVSKMLFEQFKPAPESSMIIRKDEQYSESVDQNANYEIPLERIIAVRYTLDDGKVIHIMRGKKSTQT